MSAYKELSKYYSEDKRIVAEITKMIGTRQFVVKVISPDGAWSASFLTEEEAEQYAEDMVV